MEQTLNLLLIIFGIATVLSFIMEIETIYDMPFLGDMQKFIIIISTVLILIYLIPTIIHFFIHGSLEGNTNNISTTLLFIIIITNILSYFEKNKNVAIFKIQSEKTATFITTIILIIFVFLQYLVRI